MVDSCIKVLKRLVACILCIYQSKMLLFKRLISKRSLIVQMREEYIYIEFDVFDIFFGSSCKFVIVIYLYF